MKTLAIFASLIFLTPILILKFNTVYESDIKIEILLTLNL